MKRFFITVAVLFFISVLYAKVFIYLPWGETEITPRLSVFGKNEVLKNNPVVAVNSADNPVHQKLVNYIRAGNWHLLKPYFSNGKYSELMSHFVLSTKASNTKSAAANIPYLFSHMEGNTVILKHARTGEVKRLNFQVTGNQPNQVISYSVTNGSQSAAAFTLSMPATPYNFVKLPSSSEDKPDYYVNYLEEYTKNKDVEAPSAEGIPFAQIDFEALEFEYKKCILGICKTETFQYDLGKVISGKDLPDNSDGFINPYLSDVTDLTAFTTSIQASYLQFNGYTLTAVIVDKEKRKIVFLRDGLEPWTYGDHNGEVQFEAPIAAKVLNNILYVLDASSSGARIYRFSINHAPSGEFSINNLGLVNLGSAQATSPMDIGGFEGTTSSVLLLADGSGIFSIDVNNTNGQAISNPRLYSSAIDPNDSQNIVSLNNIKRLDSDKDGGYAVVITFDNHIYSFNNLEATSANTTSELDLSYYTHLSSSFYPTNLAYMHTEEKWYLTDYTGKMHTLSPEGRHIGVGGTAGAGEDGGELYFPTGITPNPIEDPNNQYRYRFIVANKWSYNTGFKLFAPDVFIPDFNVFENLNDQKLMFTFTTSGKWQSVEFGKGITFSGLVVNGQAVNPAQWQGQITPGTVAVPGDQLTNYPNTIELTPANIPGLRRGWNTAQINVTLYRDGSVGDKIIQKNINFYWLPTSFTPGADLTNGKFKLNQYSQSDNGKVDFIYKDISVGQNGSFFVDNDKVFVSENFGLTLMSGATFYGKNTLANPLDNFHFEAGSSIHVNNGGYICLNNSGSPGAFIDRSELKQHIVLDPTYQLGVNPPTLSDYTGSTCKTPCEFLDPNAPKVSFSAAVDYATGPAFDVMATPSTSYCDRYRWKVDRVETNGTLTPITSQTFNGTPVAGKLNQLLSITFASCKKYQITLSIACNQTDFVASAQNIISTAPLVNAGVDQQICNSQSSEQLTGFIPANGTWSSPLSNITTGGNVQTSAMQLDVPVELTLTATDAFGCTNTDKKSVALISTPAKPTITSNSPVCEKQTLQLNTSYVSDALYQWSGPSGVIGSFSSPVYEISNVKPAKAGNYSVSVIVQGCKSPASNPVNVVVNTLTTVDAGSDLSVCVNGSPFTLTGGSPASGTWSGVGVSGTTFSPAISGAGNRVITYSFTDAHNCLNSDSRTISVGPVINIGSVIEVCQNANPITIADVTPSGGTFSGTGITNASGIFNPAGLSPGTYSISYLLTQGSCTSVATKQIIVKPIPGALTINSNSPVCEGQFLTLDASAVTGATYQWTTPSGNYVDVKTLSYKASLTSQGNYSVVANLNGCSRSATTAVVVHELPVVDLGEPLVLCDNSSISMDAGNFYSSYQWSKNGTVIPGSTGGAINISSGGSYSVQVSNSFGCTNKSAIKVSEKRNIISHISQTSGNFTAQLTDYAGLGNHTEVIDDINGDGVKDLLSTAYKGTMINGNPLYDVWLMFLKSDGTVKSQQLITLPGVSWMNATLARYSDIDGDGIDEIIIGQPNEYNQSTGFLTGGCIYIISLNQNGTVKTSNRIALNQLKTLSFYGQYFGSAIESIGDIDNNGRIDLAVTAIGEYTGEGSVYILLLNSNLTVSSYQEISRTAGTLSYQTSFAEYFGSAITCLGDRDGDLINDIAVTTKGTSSPMKFGNVIFINLNSNGTVKSQSSINYATDIDPTVVSRNNIEDFGTAIENIGDIDQDGVNDIIIGVPGRYNYPTISGVAWIVALNSNGTVKSKTLMTSPSDIGQSFSKDPGSNRVYFGQKASDGGPARGAINVMELNNECNDCSVSSMTVYRDLDGDGFGNPNESVQTCSARDGFVSNNTDCNDANAAINPAAVEICDGIDNNCDGIIDFEVVVNDASICQGASGAQLSATGGTTYSWSPVTGLSNPAIANPIALPSATTTYTLSVTNNTGCTVVKNVVVTVNAKPALPTIIASPGASVCEGTQVTFTSNAASASQGIGVVSRPPLSTLLGGGGFPGGIYEAVSMGSSSGNYVVCAVDNVSGCLSDNASITITVNPLPPTPAMTVTPTSICLNGTVSVVVNTPGAPITSTYTRPAGYTYLGGGGGQGGFGETVRLSQSGNFVLTYTNTTSGCTTTTTIPVTASENAYPVGTIPTRICAGATISVPYTVSSCVTLGAGNIFTAQLSDASGSFASPVNIGTLTSMVAGTINATIPAGTPSGANYRIRIISSAPPLGVDNGVDITISTNCGGLTFDGADDRVIIPHNAAYNVGTGSFTIEAWVRIPSGSANLPVLSKRTVAGDGFLFQPTTDGTTNGKKLLFVAGGVSYTSNVFANSIYDNTCHHIAVTRSATTLSFYLDGAAIGTATMSNSINSTGSLYVGRDVPNSQTFNGTIDEVRFWNVVKTALEINSLKNVKIAGNATGLIGNWDFNESSGQVVYDGSITSVNGSLGTNATAADAQDPIRAVAGSCYIPTLQTGIAFDGVDDRAIIPTNAAYTSIGTGDFTMETWIKTSSTAQKPILSNRKSGSYTNTFMWITYSSATKFLLQINGNNYLTPSFPSIANGVCHHLAITRASGVLTFYIDGISVGTMNGGGSIGAANNLTIGYDGYDNASISANINEVRLWNVARTATEISNNISLVLSNGTANLIGYWKLKEPNGEAILDASATVNNGYLGSNAAQFDAQNPIRNNISCYSADRLSDLEESLVHLDSLINESEVYVYPNPFTHETNIIVKGEEGKQSLIQVIDLNGRVLEKLNVNNNEKTSICQNLGIGVYILEVYSFGRRSVHKVVKI